VALLSAFNPHQFSEATIRTVATGREADLKEILATIHANLGGRTIQHLILSAPRGFGKSFMMRHVQIEVERIAREQDLPLAAVLMPEEMPHVREPETLIRELTRGLTGGAGADAELTWHEDDGAAFEGAVEALEAAVGGRVGTTGLCVALVENFDSLLRRAFPRDLHRSRLRALLTARDSRLMLIAASASGAFDRDYDSRLFQAFKEVTLEPWSVEDCLAFFDRQRSDAGKPPLDDLARARATAVALFIGGTPRLATLLGDVLLGEDVLQAAELLKKLVDELTPYYKERIEALPGRSQKLLDALLRGGEPATPSEIARRVKAATQSAIAGPFSDLAKERVIIGEKATGSAEVLYRVADRVFAHYYRFRVVDHDRGLCPLEALVDLLADYFSPEEKRGKTAEFAQQGRIEEARVMARLRDADLGRNKVARLSILRQLWQYYIPKRLAPLASDLSDVVLRAVADDAREGAVDEAYARIRSALSAAPNPRDRALLLLARSRLDAYEGIEGGLVAAEQAIEAAEPIEDHRFALIAGLGRAWSLGELDRNGEAYELAIRLGGLARAHGEYAVQAAALRDAAFSLGGLQRHEEAVETARSAAELARQAGEVDGLAVALRYAAFSLGRLNRHEEAVESARNAAELARQAGDVSERAVALRYAAFSLGRLNRHVEAVETARSAAELARQAGDVSEQAGALRCAAFSLGMLRRHEEAVETARNAAELARQAGDVSEQSVALRCAALSLGMLNRHEEAVETARSAAKLARQAGDLITEAQALIILAQRLGRSNTPVAAIGALADAARILNRAPDSALAAWLIAICGAVAFDALGAPYEKLTDAQSFHELLLALSEKLDLEGERRACLNAWLTEFSLSAIRRCADADQLDAFADAIALHFPSRFDKEISRLKNAARYHRSGRDRAMLARLDPDFARTLEAMFAPRNDKTPKQKSKATTRRKR
jgi:hypothetical protein